VTGSVWLKGITQMRADLRRFPDPGDLEKFLPIPVPQLSEDKWNEAYLPKKVPEDRVGNVDPGFFRSGIRRRVANTALRPLSMSDGKPEKLTWRFGCVVGPLFANRTTYALALASSLTQKVFGAQRRRRLSAKPFSC
jgi:hypothetical protein